MPKLCQCSVPVTVVVYACRHVSVFFGWVEINYFPSHLAPGSRFELFWCTKRPGGRRRESRVVVL